MKANILKRKLSLQILRFATCLLFPLSFDSVAEPNDQARAHYANGYDLQKNRKYRDAVIEFERALTAYPHYGDAHYLLGHCYHTLNDYDRSIKSFENALSLGYLPKKSEKALATIYPKAAALNYQRGKYNEAILRYEQALQLDSRISKATLLYQLGLAYGKSNREDKAIQSLNEATQTDPNFIKAHNKLADIYHRRRDFAAAANSYSKAIETDSSFTPAYGGLARTKFSTEDIEGVIELMHRATSINPDYTDGHLLLGIALIQMGRQHEAITPLKKAIGLDIANAEAHFRLGEALYGMGDYREARSASERALRNNKSLAPAQSLLGDTHFKLGEFQEAKTWYLKAQESSRFKDYATAQLEEIERLKKSP
ncbi:MAG: tetratricopeptide repeat protein [Candidatus Latescibacterota bacterium]|nr:tetratricopeptide repeat protein [Candidatus Latescibacterota bacterium]